MKKLIVIADWASDSFTNQEVKTTVEGYLSDPSNPNISFVSSTPSTIHTSYIISQMVEIEERYGRPLDTVIFQNTDPRLNSDTSLEKSKGADFVIIRLKTGLYICGPNAGYDFTMIKDKIEEMFLYKELDKGSQFRSRDLYARVCAHLMDSLEDDMDLEEISTNMIPEFQGYHIGHIDNYGNIKTTMNEEVLKGKYELDDEVPVTINGIQKKVKYVSNLFGGNPGELVIYPGSSGKKDEPYLEISVWRHFTEQEKTTGMHAFNNPQPGDEITIGV